MRYRIIVLFASFLTDSFGGIEAIITTSLGTIKADLDFEEAPQTVANFMTLAQGTRSWLDESVAAVRQVPLYQGLAFDDVSNTDNQKLAGIGPSGIGYFFPDEFHATLTHEPYVLAMSNDGPNTNGGRFYLTGDLAHPDRDNHHTVFGKIPDGASRAVIDDLLAAGAGATELLSITIRRSDPAALAFDENAISLPEVTAIAGPLTMPAEGGVSLKYSQPALSVLASASSPDLLAWASESRNFVDLDGSLPGASQIIAEEVAAKSFFQISLVRYPESPAAPGASSFANRTLTLEGPGTGKLIYQFDGTGLAGTYENVLFPDEPPFFAGNFQVRDEVPAIFGPYSFRILLFAEGLGQSPFNLIRGGFDEASPTSATGRMKITLSGSLMGAGLDERGSLKLTRP